MSDNPLDTQKELSELLGALPMDLRAEIVLCDLVKAGIDLEDFFIRPVGTFKRRFGKDIASIERKELKDNDIIFHLNVNREGFYDMLPQALFHNPPGKTTKAFKNASEMADEVKARKQEEKEARNFFHIYETELYNMRIATEWQERKLIETISITMDDDDFLSYWNLPAIFNKTQKGILFYLYPIIDTIRGNLSLMETTYNLFIPHKIKLERGFKNKLNVVPIYQNILGRYAISSDFVCGNSTCDVLDTITIQVGPVPQDQVQNYIPRAKNIRMIKQLNRYFMPLFFETEIVVHADKSKFKLSPFDVDAVRLGMNSYL